MASSEPSSAEFTALSLHSKAASDAGHFAPRVLMATKHSVLMGQYARELTISQRSLTTTDPQDPNRRETNTWRLQEIVDVSYDHTGVWVKLPGSFAPPKTPTTLHVRCESEGEAVQLAQLLSRGKKSGSLGLAA